MVNRKARDIANRIDRQRLAEYQRKRIQELEVTRE